MLGPLGSGCDVKLCGVARGLVLLHLPLPADRTSDAATFSLSAFALSRRPVLPGERLRVVGARGQSYAIAMDANSLFGSTNAGAVFALDGRLMGFLVAKSAKEMSFRSLTTAGAALNTLIASKFEDVTALVADLPKVPPGCEGQ